MSERIVRLLLAELDWVRLRCARCKCVSEIKTESLATRSSLTNCPHCGAGWQPQSPENAFNYFGTAYKMLTEAKDKFEIEFTVQEKQEKQ